MRRVNFNRQTKLLLSGATIAGSTIGIGCAYIYAAVETLVVSK
jgi:hypothetical protein